MKLSHIILAAALAGEACAWGMGSKTAYNKWNENELERWLSDHNVPYPTPADRKDLEKLVKENWNSKVVSPYSDWDTPQLQHYLSEKGQQIDVEQAKSKNWLVDNVKKAWEETESTAEEAYGSVKGWIFDSWSESALKAFLDRHGIPNPQPRTRDSLLATARDNYETVANKLGETTAYPGNWLYESWSDSDLKKWLETHGYAAPQPSTRDKLIAVVRRNSRLASLKANSAANSAQYHANNAKEAVSDTIFDSWSDSKLKEFLDKNNVKVPQGSGRNELLALARRNKAYYTGDTVSASANSAYGSATSYAGEKASQATDTAAAYKNDAFEALIENWSDSRLKEYLDSRGVPVPQNGKRDELLAKVRLSKHKAATGFGAWTFDTWTYDNLKKWLDARGHKASANAAASRDELYSSAVSAYSVASVSAASAASVGSASAASAASSAASVASASASSAGTVVGSSATSAGSKATDAAKDGANVAYDSATDGAAIAYASLTSALAAATDSAKDITFDTWSDSELKAYLDRYGINTYQGSTRNELIAAARRNAHAFRYGSADQGVYGQFSAGMGWVRDRIYEILGYGAKKAEVAGDKAYEAGQKAGDRAYEAGQQASDAAKEKVQQGYDATKEKVQEGYDRVKEEL
ncbi:hypothetical protein P167DRAFT_536552 [Morchella conica CCBAS932]|uniref:Stress response protein ish1 n=1 Tax=Morchella conica CCBAS932 TaxID=1392247 RepID=A0A3N4KQ85_9PEZI|nr:hypothetical protein P167DRAFT_536552 [Morchella conica CCBAS932]